MYSEANLEEVPEEIRHRVQRLQREREHYRAQLAAINAQLKAPTLTEAERRACRKQWSNLMGAIKACGDIIGEVFASYAKREAIRRRDTPPNASDPHREDR